LLLGFNLFLSRFTVWEKSYASDDRVGVRFFCPRDWAFALIGLAHTSPPGGENWRHHKRAELTQRNRH
jgi:hypothetical protein